MLYAADHRSGWIASSAEEGAFARSFHYGTRGTEGMTHVDPDDRPPAVFDNTVTLHCGGARPSWVMLPIVPSR